MFEVIYWLNVLRPSLGSTGVMRAGELLVLFLMLLSYLYHFKSVTARALLWATAIAIYVLCQTLQIYLLGKPATLTDAIDPLRFFIPLAAFSFGAALPISMSTYQTIVRVTVVIIFTMLLQFTLPRGNILHTAYSVENLVTWSRYSGTLFNHIEPAWITIALTAVLLSRSERDNWVGLVFVFAVVIIFTALSRSKATMLSGFLSIFLLGLRAYPRATLAIAPAIFSTGVYVVLSVPYFYKAYAAVSSGDLEGNVSVYLRYLDYVSVASLLSEGNLLLFGNGRAQSLGDESYMGTSTLMFVYRYGLLGAFFYYSTVMYMSFKSSAKWASGAIIFLSVLVLDLISNGSEALKGAMIFFTTLGMLSRKSEGQREYV